MNKFLFTALFGSFLCADLIQDVGINFGYSKLSSLKNDGKTHNESIISYDDHTDKDGGKFMFGINYGIGSKINDTFALKADIFVNFNNTKKEYTYTDTNAASTTLHSQYKIKNAIGIMPVAEFKIHNNITIFAGAGIASTKVEEKHGSTDDTTDDNYKTSKRKGGFAYKVGFDITPTESFSFGVTYQSIKTKIKFTEDLNNTEGVDEITKSKASARANNIMLSFKYHF